MTPLKLKPLALAIALAAASAEASVITDWNERALDAIRATSTPPPRASRGLAILHAAIYDSVNGINPTHQPYAVAPAAPAGASQEAAVIAAAHTALVALFPSLTVVFDAALASDLDAIPNSDAKEDGIAWGELVGAAVLLDRANDGSTTTVAYTPGTLPGQWRPTPSAFAPALLPHWGSVETFGVPSLNRFVPSAPPKLSSSRYAAEVNFVKAIGSKTSAVRSADQTLVAQFWANGGGTATPPGHWNQIARQLIDQEGVDLAGQARLLAQVNIALADAGILCWKAKYTYNYWRPVAAIREADTDGNAATVADPTWTPLLATPPFPEYTSGHSTFSGAASAVLIQFFGTDDIAFTAHSDDAPGILRGYSKISEAAAESGMSRIYGGIHFMSGNLEGLKCGARIGNYVGRRLLKPIGEVESED